MKRILFLTAVLFFLSSNMFAQDNQNEKRQTVYKGVSDQNCALEMAFGSYGAGIDREAFAKCMALIETYKLDHSSKTVGREGETRICLPLNGISALKKRKITKKLKAIADHGQLVSISIR